MTPPANQLARIDTSKKALARITSVRDVKKYVSAMTAVQKVRKDAGAELAEINEHVEKRIRLMRRGGQLLHELGVAPGNPQFSHDERIGPKLAELGIDHNQSSRWQALSDIPDDVLDAFIEEAKSREDTLSVASTFKFAKSLKRPPEATANDVDACTVTDLHRLVAAGAEFGTIYADPPWPYDNQATRASTSKHYDTECIDWICQLPIAELTADQGHLHLWTTNAFLFDAKRVIEAWGFEYKSCFVWVKPQMGIGNYWRVSHEFLLLGVRGGLTFRNRGQMSWAECSREQHSKKPEEIRTKIEAVSPRPRLELFARQAVPGWVCWGNQTSRRVFAQAAKGL